MDIMERITLNPRVMGGKPCIRGLRVTVGLMVGLVATGMSAEQILRTYPYLEADDIPAALGYAAWLAEASEVPLLAVGALIAVEERRSHARLLPLVR